MIGTWQAPQSDGTISEELLVSFDAECEHRILILPAWFDEANKLRRLTVEVMRRLEGAEIDSFLPDLPGCNESTAPLEQQTLPGWRLAAEAAAQRFQATHVLTIRAGALVAPAPLPGWRYAQQTGAKLLRGMIRARIIAAREDGREETSDKLMDTGRSEGLTLAGWPIGAEMFRELEHAETIASETRQEIAQSDLGGSGLWLRAEPDFDAKQADALAALVTERLRAEA
ncbi:MAG: hypothetical protein AAF941_08580 [Pseudomonadota bacterium]